MRICSGRTAAACGARDTSPVVSGRVPAIAVSLGCGRGERKRRRRVAPGESALGAKTSSSAQPRIVDSHLLPTLNCAVMVAPLISQHLEVEERAVLLAAED